MNTVSTDKVEVKDAGDGTFFVMVGGVKMSRWPSIALAEKMCAMAKLYQAMNPKHA